MIGRTRSNLAVVFNAKRGKDRQTLAFVVLVGAIILSVTLLLPLGFDNDVYESMAWTLYAYHGLPYIASWDMNFPGIVFIHWASIALFGASDFGFRFFDYLVHIALVAIYYRFLRNWLSPRAAVFGTLLYALYYASGQWGLAGQRDTYASLFLLCAVSLFVSLQKRYRRTGLTSLAIGVCCGTAFLIRPTYILFAISFLVLIGNFRRIPRDIILYLTGCIVPVGAFLLPYVFIPNGLTQVYDSIVRFNLEVYSSVHVPINLWSNGRTPIYLFALIGVVLALRKRVHPDTLLFILLIVSALASPIIMGKYFLYHFEPLVLIAIGFAAAGFDDLMEMISIKWLRNAVAVISLFLFALFYYPRHMVRIFFNSLRQNESGLGMTYERAYPETQLFGLQAQSEVKSYVDRDLHPGEPVEYISLFPSLRWRLARTEATQFTTLLPLAASILPPGRPVPDFIESWRKSFIDSLAHIHPKFLITSKTQAGWPFAGTTADSALHSIPGFDSLLAADYSLDTVIRGFVIYRVRT